MRLLADPDGDLSRLGVAFRRDGTMDLTVSGKSDILVGATQCILEGPADEFTADCEWTADSYGAALSRFNYLRVTLGPCLAGAELELTENDYSRDGYSVLRRFSGSVEEDDEDHRSVDISLELIEYTAPESSAQYWVQLEFER